MSQNSLVVPARIILKEQSASHFVDSAKSGLYNESGEEYLLFRSPEPEPVFSNHESIYFAYWRKNIDSNSLGKKISSSNNEYTDKLFLEQINLKTTDEAYSFLKKYSHYSFILQELIADDGYRGELIDGLLITRNDYLQNILAHIQTFRHLQNAYFALADYSTSPDNEEKALQAFRKCLDYFDAQCLTNVMRISNDTITNPVVQMLEKDAFITLDKRGNDEASSLALSECKRYIDEKIRAETSGVFIVQNLDDFTFEYHCPTLSAAMYEKMLLSIFNNDEYRQCAKCSLYFKLDKHHPQSLCDEHMASRRRKRQKAKQKDKNEELKSQAFVDNLA